MRSRRTNTSGALAVLLGLLAAGPAVAFPPPPPAIGALHLPQDNLQPYALNAKAAFYVQVSSIRRTAGVVDANVLQVSDPGAPGPGGAIAVEIVLHVRHDCTRHTRAELGAMAYDEDGGMVIWLPAYPAQALNMATIQAEEAAILCGAGSPVVAAPGAAPAQTVRGHAAALKAGRESIRQRRAALAKARRAT